MKKPNFAAMNPVVAEAIQQIMAEQGDKFSLEEINLADLGRRTGISRAKLDTPPENRRSDRRSPTARPQKSYTPAVGQTPCV